jgi:hypothetical protein
MSGVGDFDDRWLAAMKANDIPAMRSLLREMVDDDDGGFWSR